MTRRSSLLATVAVTVLVSGPGLAAGAPPRSARSAAIDALVSRYAELGLFNGSALVAERGSVILKKGYGLANEEWRIPNQPDTVFRLGSVTKQFTSMLVLQLVDEGKLALDARLSDVLPYYRKDTGSRITIHNLLNHTSGIPNYTTPTFFAESARSHFTVEQFVTKFCSGELEFDPGSRFAYSNSGYYALGAVVERVTGKPYGEVLAQRITKPLGMRSTRLDDAVSVIEHRAAGYQRDGQALGNAPFLDMTAAFSAGALVSTVEDLYLWDQALYAGTLLSPKLTKAMFTPGLGDYAYGWGVREAPIGPGKANRTVIGHDGGIYGFESLIRRIVDERHLVVLLDNHRGSSLREIYDGIADILYGRTPPPPKRPIGEALARTIAASGVAAAIAQYREAKRSEPDAWDFSETQLNLLGYALLGERKVEDAIAVFKLNAEAFPQSGNVYDSLAEALAAAGQKEQAIKNYARSLELDPTNRNAADQLAKLTTP